MKNRNRTQVALAILGVAAGLWVNEIAEAQMVRQGAGGAGVGLGAAGGVAAPKAGVLRIRRLPKPGRGTMIRTPEFQTSVGRSSRNRRPREWAVFDVEYETAPEWLDSLDFTYSVMTYLKDKDGKDAYSLFQVSVAYIDIQRGEHSGCVLLAPNTLARFGMPVALAVEVSQDGVPLANESVAIDSKLPEADWWKNPKIVDSPIVTRRAGLLERSKTPFALINMDDYEVVK